MRGNESMSSQQIMLRANLRGWRRDTDVPQSLTCKHFSDQKGVRARAHSSGDREGALSTILPHEQAARRGGSESRELCGFCKDAWRVLGQTNIMRVKPQTRLEVIYDACGAKNGVNRLLPVISGV
jgi:hypothetical protein